VKTEDEGLFVRQHAHWAASLKKAIEVEQQSLIATDKEARS
jgi:benzoate/toluate 1,2-dioxygenase alpha subunit